MGNKMKRKPVTLITGYLGSGKTTLLNQLLSEKENKGLALIVNDMGSINIDAKLLQQSNVVESKIKMVELQNGCICCTLQDAFMDQIEKLSADDRVDKIMVEASGISNPAAIADGFLAYAEVNEDANVYLSTIVTVVDADRIYSEFLEEIEKEIDKDSDDEPDIINLVIDQIEFCNTVLLNKCDLLERDKIERVKKVIHELQPEAEIIECVQGKVDSKRIFDGKHFDYDEVMNSSTIQKALAREKKMTQSGKEEYGVTSFVYEDRRPFDYDKFMEFMLNAYPEEVIRAKGYLWFGNDDSHVQLFEQAGQNASITEVSNWIAALKEDEQKKVFDNCPEILADWDERYGDRMNQIVFIGKQISQEKITSQLEACLA